MSIPCKKHLETPYRGYCPCAACELEHKDAEITRLRAEVERLEAQVLTLQTEYVRQNPCVDPQDEIDELRREVERLKVREKRLNEQIAEWHGRLCFEADPPNRVGLAEIADEMLEALAAAGVGEKIQQFCTGCQTHAHACYGCIEGSEKVVKP